MEERKVTEFEVVPPKQLESPEAVVFSVGQGIRQSSSHSLMRKKRGISRHSICLVDQQD